MGISGIKESSEETAADYDRATELKAFDDSKAGVKLKGLIDGGVVKVPKIFIRPPDELAEELNSCQTDLQVPVIDLSRLAESDRRKEVVHEVRIASEKWGFFQVVNHGIPISVLDEMMDGIQMFHEHDPEGKKAFYSFDPTKRVRFGSNFRLYQSIAANWRDTLAISMVLSDHLEPDEVPPACRAITVEYIKHVTKLGDTLFELLSEALGLQHDYLTSLECARGRSFACHYYPACPEPELTLGASKHSDPSFLTILLQDQFGSLQVIHEDQWVNVQPIAGGLIVNIGDLLQIISNNKFRSVNHRLLANRVGPRISMASFFNGVLVPPKLYGPIQELISEENPPVYKEFLLSDYFGKFNSRGIHKSYIHEFKL